MAPSLPEFIPGTDKCTRRERGQALVEFAGACALVGVTVAGCGKLLLSEWNRTRCAYLAYETAHAVLTGTRPPASLSRNPALMAQSAVGQTQEWVEVELHCASTREKVRLWRLEAAP